ncbi:MAG: hypothetical protein ACSLE0_13650 [Chitinophagaceae bacterium]
MKLSILLLAFVAIAFGSCSTAYKSGQTPDDVYFSPSRPEAEEYVRIEKQDDRYYRGSDDYYEDRFLRMRLQNRYRWSALDDYYFNNTYAYNAYGYYNNWYSPWNNYYTWNSYYNPYYRGIPYYPGSVIVKNPRLFVSPSKPVVFNPGSYSSGNNANRPSLGSRSANNGYNNSNTNSTNNRTGNKNSLGESVRKVFTNSNSNNSNNSNSTPSRTYTPSSNSNSNSSSSSSRSSSSSSSSGSSGGGSSRPVR